MVLLLSNGGHDLAFVTSCFYISSASVSTATFSFSIRCCDHDLLFECQSDGQFADGVTSALWYQDGEFVGDNKTVLDSEDDAAFVNWGCNWRMPTDAEWTELRENCTWTWTTQNGVNGYRVSGTNSNSIFLPAAGYRYNIGLDHAGVVGCYWSSSLSTDNHSGYARDLVFESWYVKGEDNGRSYGNSVRPVCQ